MKNSYLALYLLCAGVVGNLSADYSDLKEYKARKKAQIQTEIKSNYKLKGAFFIIDFKDINKMDTYALEQRYNLKLYQCIADGICVFKFKDFKKEALYREEILKRESNIKNIRLYKAYDFTAF